MNKRQWMQLTTFEAQALVSAIWQMNEDYKGSEHPETVQQLRVLMSIRREIEKLFRGYL